MNVKWADALEADRWRVVFFDQRGCGKSTPFGKLEHNGIDALVGDMEKLRESLGIERWAFFGGSWGTTTLGLAYDVAHPERCIGFPFARRVFRAVRGHRLVFVGRAARLPGSAPGVSRCDRGRVRQASIERAVNSDADGGAAPAFRRSRHAARVRLDAIRDDTFRRQQASEGTERRRKGGAKASECRSEKTRTTPRYPWRCSNATTWPTSCRRCRRCRCCRSSRALRICFAVSCTVASTWCVRPIRRSRWRRASPARNSPVDATGHWTFEPGNLAALKTGA